MEKLLSDERDKRYPSDHRRERRKGLIVIDRDLAAIRMDLGQICVLLLPAHPDCEPVSGVGAGPDPALAVYLNDLHEIGVRVDRLDQRIRFLQQEYTSAKEVMENRLVYLFSLANEGMWWLLGYGEFSETEAAALEALAMRLTAPEGAAAAAERDDIVALVGTARSAIAYMTKAFLNELPPPRERALDRYPEPLQAVRDAIADACARAGSAYPVCDS